jgi:hypothetical protein
MLVNPDAKNSYFDSRSIKRLQDDPALRSQVSALLHNEKPVDENGVAREISEEARAMEEKLREQREHYSEYVAGIQNVNSAEQQGDAMEEYAKDMGKIMMVFRRMANGDIVPQSDEKKLMEYDDKMYQVAKNMQARELLEKKKQYEKKGAVVNPQALTEYAAYWMPIHKAGVKPSTYNAYLSILAATIKPIGSIYLHALTSDHIAEAFAALTGKSASYIHKARILLIEILDSATDAGYMEKNPARAQSLRPPKGTKGTHRAITHQERAVIESTPHRMRLAALIMLYCGLRRGELLGFRPVTSPVTP